jgi:rhodanese-related sulfurtransferase
MNGFKNITVAALEKLLPSDEVHLLDVRTDAEIAQGKIPQGKSLPLHLIPLQMSQLDKGATTILYCRSGGRSAQAAAFFAANGFVDIYNLQGGIIAWVNAGFPVES